MYQRFQTIVMHETIWTEYLISNLIHICPTIFVPVLEYIPIDGKYPKIENTILLRGEDKYKKMLLYESPIIIDTKFDYANLLILSNNKPKTILLISCTSVLNYKKLSIEQKLKLSSIKFVSFWDSDLKIPDSEGVADSCNKILNNLYGSSNKCLHILLLGYGKIGQPIANALKNMEHIVYIYETNSLKRLLAFKRNYIVGELNDISLNIDLIIDTTANDNVISEKDLDYFAKKSIYCLSFSTNSNAFYFSPNFINKNGSIFIFNKRGLENFYQVGGNDFKSMQITGRSIIYFLKNYENMLTRLKKLDNYSLYTFSEEQEIEIANNIMPKNQFWLHI